MLYGKLSGLENLAYFARWRPACGRAMRSFVSCWSRAGLPSEAAGRPVAAYSKGMRQKVGIAIALAKKPRRCCWTNRPRDSIRWPPMNSRG